ncbi:MAG: O-antigen ligase family protein [Terriglobales bacterium]
MTGWRPDGRWLAAAVVMAPLSIAVSETLLAAALATRLYGRARDRCCWELPRVFWWWLLGWAGWEVGVRLLAPPPRGWSEMRHLALLLALFLVVPALTTSAQRLWVWRGMVYSATLGSAVLTIAFLRLWWHYRHLLTGDQLSLGLRTGGLLGNWMVYASVEAVAMAGLASLWMHFPEQRWQWTVLAAVNAIAVALSLTRTLWLCCAVLAFIALGRQRWRWLAVAPVAAALVWRFGPAVIRLRVLQTFRPGYFSNAERWQMLKVGWRMLRSHPWVGVGRVDLVYTSYLSPGATVPDYHGHLHNNLVQLLAVFGWPVLLPVLLVLAVVVLDLARARRQASDRAAQCLAQAGVLALAVFMIAGLFDYTYGHSLGLIVIAFALLAALSPLRQRDGSG